MKKKAIAAALLLFVVGFGAFAEMGMYLKGALGYGVKKKGWETTTTIADIVIESEFDTTHMLFAIIPTFGIEPWQGNDNAFLRGLSFEFSVDLGFGMERDSALSSVVISPMAMAVYTHRAGKTMMPYGGLGISIPIFIVGNFGESPYTLEVGGVSTETSTVKAGFNVNLMAGVAYAITEKIQPVVEANFGFGTGISIGLRAGVVYRLGI